MALFESNSRKTILCLFVFLGVITAPCLPQAQARQPLAAPAETVHYTYPRICPRSDQFRVFVDGEEAAVFHTSAGNFAAFESDGAVQIEVELYKATAQAKVLPQRLGIAPVITGKRLAFRLPPEEKVLVEIDGMEQLFIYANPITKEKPSPDDPGVKYFPAGQVYEVGELRLKDNETLYIEGGAVVRGVLRATSAQNIRIAGNGVLDGGYYSEGHRKFVLFEDCRDVRIEGIIMIEPPGWMVTLYHSENVEISDIKQLGEGHGTDGIDIVASRKVRIENCMLRNGDDCIVVKSFLRPQQYSQPVLNDISGAEDILATGCSVQANGGGQAFEIGHELILNPVRNIRFEDCDVLGVHGQGGVFGIHNCDGATVSDVRYENIRVDHYYNKLIDMRIIKSRWSKEEKAGHAKDISLKNIRVTNSIYNPGYSISLIGGYDEAHLIENVTIEDFYINGKKITNADELDLYIKRAKNVVFR